MNTGEVAYILTYNHPTRPPCCVFFRDFHPPTPTFARDNHLKHRGTHSINGENADFYWLDIPRPGPFIYAWFTGENGKTVRPASFSFPTVPPEEWTVQNFENFVLGDPDNSFFQVPDTCIAAKDCVVFDDGPDELLNNQNSHLRGTT